MSLWSFLYGAAMSQSQAADCAPSFEIEEVVRLVKIRRELDDMDKIDDLRRRRRDGADVG